jgi:nicotinate-nucleotide adenylyltransferase
VASDAGLLGVAGGSRAARRRLGLFGGTFDPPHYGHLAAAQETADLLRLERVLFLPAGWPPHKRGEPISPLEVRLRMVELAIADNPTFGLSLADAERPGPSYTVDLLARFRAELGPGLDLFFIVGMDSLWDLTTWKDPQRILAQCTLVAVTRPGYPSVELGRLDLALPGAAERIRLLETPGVAISSTDLRERIAAGRPIRYLVPDCVRELIETCGLYRPTPAR